MSLYDLDDEDFEEPDSQVISQLRVFTKSEFEPEMLRQAATDMKYKREMGRFIERQFSDGNIGDLLLDWLVRNVYTGRRLTDKVKRELRPSAQEVVSDFLNGLRKSTAKSSGINTTSEETQGYYIVRNILWNVINDPEDVVMRDHKTYCTIQLGEGARSRKRICLLRFNRHEHKRVGLFDSGDEEQVEISSVYEINRYAERIRARARQILKLEK